MNMSWSAVASYVWSHIQSVITSEDPSLIILRELLSASDLVVGVPDPVWYDPRRHSRHVAHTVHLDARTSLTVTGDLAWGRYSPAPRALYLTAALHHDGDTHQLAQVYIYLSLRVIYHKICISSLRHKTLKY